MGYKLLIIGGKLQGLEAAYLAKKACIKVILIDKNSNVPAKNICDEYICTDVLRREPALIEALNKVDIVLPTLENREVLEFLDLLSKELEFLLAFDLKAFDISSSKIISDKLFFDNQIHCPAYFPKGKAPYVAKLANDSGSKGVRILNNDEEVSSFFSNLKKNEVENWVIQEYIKGPAYSIEVIGCQGKYKAYEITQIHVDEKYDCNRVTAPCFWAKKKFSTLEKIALDIAKLIDLKGIMDLEVIENEGIFYALEIDARLPSQTPTAVYFSTGTNYIKEIINVFNGNVNRDGFSDSSSDSSRCGGSNFKKVVSFEHISIKGGKLTFPGENAMSSMQNTEIIEGFFGAYEAITDFEAFEKDFVATLIFMAENEIMLEENRVNTIREITELCKSR